MSDANHPDASSASQQKPDLLSESVPRGLLRLAWQSVPAHTLWEACEIIEVICLAHLGGVALAGFGYALPIMLFFWGVAGPLFRTAAQHVVARANAEDAKRYFVHAIFLNAFTATIIGLLWYAFREPIFRLVGADGEVLQLILDFVTIYALQYPMLVVSTVGPMLLADRGLVKPIAPHVVVASLIVMAGYPVFILGLGPFPEFSLAGVAIAVGVGRVYMLATFIWVSHKVGLWGRPKGGWFARIRDSWTDIFHEMGYHHIVESLFLGATLVIVVRLISEFGTKAVAAFAVGNRVGVMATVLSMSAAIGLAPMMTQAWQAGLGGRVRELLKFGEIIAVGAAVVGFLFVVPVSLWAVDWVIPEAGPELRTMLWVVIVMFPAIWCSYVLAEPGLQVLKVLRNRKAETGVSVLAVVAVATFGVLGVWLLGTFTGLLTAWLAAIVLYALVTSIVARRTLAARLAEKPE